MHVHVKPRYSAGSPALVHDGVAKAVARDEVYDYLTTTTWARGFVPYAAEVADHMGLAGIVFDAGSTRKDGVWRVRDWITGWVGEVDCRAVPPQPRRPTGPRQRVYGRPALRLADAVWLAQGNVQEPAAEWAATAAKAVR